MMVDNSALIGERYKYILSQKAELNKTTFKIASFYQAAIVLIGTAQYNIVLQNIKKDLPVAFAWLASELLAVIMVAVSLISIILLLGGMLAWNDYKNEEASILNGDRSLKRSKFRMAKLLRWYETYICLSVILFTMGYLAVVWFVVRAWLT
jgi:hypothetical protein